MSSEQQQVALVETHETPLGVIRLALRRGRLIGVSIGRSAEKFRQQITNLIGPFQPIAQPTGHEPFVAQLEEYFTGDRQSFEMPIDWSVLKPFQADVLRLVNVIPYGETRTYGKIARELGQPNGARAVGHANATNPMPIVIACHRVIGSDGKLTGYNAPNGIVTKEWLLHLEGRIQVKQMRLF